MYIFFSCVIEDNQVNRLMTGKSASFDFGLKTFLTPSDERNDIEAPLFLKQSIKEIKKANKNISSKKLGSDNKVKARLNLARIHKKIQINVGTIISNKH